MSIRRGPHRDVEMLRSFVRVALAVAACAAPISGQTPTLPMPTGSYAVGRRLLYILDSTRTDIKAIRADHLREFMVIVWYPAAGSAPGDPRPWIPRLWADSAAGDLAMFTRRVQPPVTVAEIARTIAGTKSFATDSAPIATAGARFPVVILSPGNFVMPSYYATFAEEFASHGYVVVGHVPTGYSRSVTLPDGRVFPRQTFDNIDVWIGDIRYLVDHVAIWDRDRSHPLYGKLDTLRVGLTGHSGGANASEVVAKDPRVRALAAIDPGLTDTAWATSKPTLILSSDWGGRAQVDTGVADMLEERVAFRRHLRQGVAFTLKGAQHMSFTDLSAIPRLQLGPNGLSQILAARRLLQAFFDESLRGVHSTLLRTGDPTAALELTP